MHTCSAVSVFIIDHMITDDNWRSMKMKENDSSYIMHLKSKWKCPQRNGFSKWCEIFFFFFFFFNVEFPSLLSFCLYTFSSLFLFYTVESVFYQQEKQQRRKSTFCTSHWTLIETHTLICCHLKPFSSYTTWTSICSCCVFWCWWWWRRWPLWDVFFVDDKIT